MRKSDTTIAAIPVARRNERNIAPMRLAPSSFQRPLTALALPTGKRIHALWIAMIASGSAMLLAKPELAFASIVLAFGLAWAAMIDIDRFVLPDVLMLGLIMAGLGFALREGLLAAWPYVVGTAAGYVALAGIAHIYRRVRGRNGLGLGDAKLLGVAGAWLGWMALPLVVLIASVVCLISVAAAGLLRGRQITSGPIPFGPYLAGAIWIVWLAQLGGRS